MKAWGQKSARAAALAALTTAAGVLASCATMPPEIPFVPDNNPDRASLTIFREQQFYNSAFATAVRIDGKTVADLKNGESVVAKAAPGDLKIAVQSEYDFRELVLPLHAEPGRDDYVDILPRSVYLERLGGRGLYALPKDKAGVAVCNAKWCVVITPAEEAKTRMSKPAA